jgi:hypothetical protein
MISKIPYYKLQFHDNLNLKYCKRNEDEKEGRQCFGHLLCSMHCDKSFHAHYLILEELSCPLSHSGGKGAKTNQTLLMVFTNWTLCRRSYISSHFHSCKTDVNQFWRPVSGKPTLHDGAEKIVNLQVFQKLSYWVKYLFLFLFKAVYLRMRKAIITHVFIS